MSENVLSVHLEISIYTTHSSLMNINHDQLKCNCIFILLEMGAFLKGREAKIKNWYLLVIECAMKFLAIAALLTFTITGTGIVILNVDPFDRYISRYLPSLILFLVRAMLILLLGSELYRVFMTYFFIAIIVLVTLNNTLQNLIKYITETSVQRSKIRISKLVLFMKAFRALEIYFKKNEPAFGNKSNCLELCYLRNTLCSLYSLFSLLFACSL